MENESCEARLRCFIGEVTDYHRRCDFHHSGPIVFTMKMAAFALSEYAANEVSDSIMALAAKGEISIRTGEPLSFSPNAGRAKMPVQENHRLRPGSGQMPGAPI